MVRRMEPSSAALRREVGVAGAVLMGLGSIVGTGVFVSLGLGAGLAGAWLPVALLGAAALAACNGLSSAQLAAAFPVSGGTYEYANRTLGPLSGFTAGWMFLTAKGASAATAGLGFAGYVLALLDGPAPWRVPLAVGTIAALTGLVLSGIRRTNVVNAVVVSVTLAGLGALVAVSAGHAPGAASVPSLGNLPPVTDVLQATALMFVAYTGYGRIATLGEEVVEPRRTIPRAIVAALIVVLLLYVGVAGAALWVLGAEGFAAATHRSAAPLQQVALAMETPWLATVLAVAACTAMAGVLLNLILGLSRVLLAMGRRGDVPAAFGRVSEGGTAPTVAVVATGAGVAALALLGDVRTTWSFSAFTVLVYYAFTNLSALRLAPEHRLYPRGVSWLGLSGCLSLALFVQPTFWAAGLGLLLVGHLLRAGFRAVSGTPS
ncbi:MAG: APC family permease [Myxococcales bacterium]|nr:APC family permease [Myxococcales bacterium]